MFLPHYTFPRANYCIVHTCSDEGVPLSRHCASHEKPLIEELDVCVAALTTLSEHGLGVAEESALQVRHSFGGGTIEGMKSTGFDSTLDESLHKVVLPLGCSIYLWSNIFTHPAGGGTSAWRPRRNALKLFHIAVAIGGITEPAIS